MFHGLDWLDILYRFFLALCKCMHNTSFKTFLTYRSLSNPVFQRR